MSTITPADKKLFFSKNDKNDPRLGEFAKSADSISEQGLYILGYPDDEGVQLNGGRVGTRLAPDQIRTYFYKMTPPDLSTQIKILDLGNIKTEQTSLGDRHQNGRNLIQQIVKSKNRWMSLGGGHDYGFADASGFLSAHSESKLKPVVVNFDAHLDVRPDNNGFNSGTPFYRLLNEFQNLFHFFEIGIQPQCNSHFHKKWAIEKDASVIEMAKIEKEGLLPLIQNQFSTFKNHPCFISIDIDVFQGSIAPGCSQSWETGLRLEKFLPAFHWLIENLNVEGIGIYEVSPPLDQDNRTSKLAALIMYQFIFSKLLRG